MHTQQMCRWSELKAKISSCRDAQRKGLESEMSKLKSGKFRVTEFDLHIIYPM